MTETPEMETMMHRAMLASPAFVLALMAACGDSAEAGEARRQMREAFDAARSYTQAEIERLTGESRERLTELQSDVEKLKNAAREHGQQAMDRLAAAVEDVEERTRAAREQVQRAVEASAEDFGEAMSHADEALREAREGLEKAWEQLGK